MPGKDSLDFGIEINSGVTFDKIYITPNYQNAYAGGDGDFLQYKYKARVIRKVGKRWMVNSTTIFPMMQAGAQEWPDRSIFHGTLGYPDQNMHLKLLPYLSQITLKIFTIQVLQRLIMLTSLKLVTITL